ncbi:thiopeptide-type bacteriocin biosynthesis protein [Nonomuraea endophytica]|uniref:thiopeptide-type bacteriocin biosynthesis protein n=1 Tax=Nonomuraea endophytica TaxID=714136 RepID=UPI0037C8E4CA
MPADRLTPPEGQWSQHNIWFPDRATAISVATQEIGPALASVQRAGELHCWWYLSKNPWRLRYRPLGQSPSPAITQMLARLIAEGRIVGSTSEIYEPETRAFGGPDGTSIAHRLFHHDSRHLLAQRRPPTGTLLGHRELSVVLCSALMRGAGLDIFEQGDVWGRVAGQRPARLSQSPQQPIIELERLMLALMSGDPRRLCRLDGTVTGYESWISAFERAGKDLAALARQGRLSRGLRAVLAHQMIFHFNRALLPTGDQAMLADLAIGAVFGRAKARHFLPTTTGINS